MKDFKKVIKEALTPHYLRESVNEDFTHSSLAITDQSQILGLDDSELLDLLNKVSYEYTPELKDSARIISQEIEDRDLTNKIHYVDNERYEFMESVNEVKTESELKDAWREWNKKHPKDQIDWNEYREEHGEHLDEVTQKEIDDIENSGNIDIAYKKALKLLNSLKDESVNEAKGGQIMPGDYVKNQHGKIYQRVDGKVGKHDAYVRVTNGKAGKKKTGLHDSFKLTLVNKDDIKEVHVDDDVYKKNKAQLQAAVKAYDKAESEGDIRGMELALAAVDMLKDESVNEDIVDDKAKIYWLQKLKSGEIDTLPDNPRMEYLRHAMRDQLAQDKEQLSRERGEMSDEEEHEHVKNLLKRNFMDEAEARVDETDMNDPVLMKARAAQMAAEKEKAKQAALKQKEDFKKTYLNKKYGSSFMDKLEAEIGLKSELQDLKDEREMLMIDMEQEAEPEGGEIADRYGSRLNKIDARMELIQKDIDDLRMYESVNENEAPVKEDRFKKNQDSYIRVTEPRFKKDPTNPNFLFGYINYDTGPGVSIALGKETMAGQIRRLSSAEAVRQLEEIGRKLSDNYDLEDLEIVDLENGVVELFAVSDDFIDMDVKSELSTAMLNEEFKVGDKVTYLGHPAVVTATKEYNGRDFVSVSYDKGTGKTKASMILVKSGDVKSVEEGTCGYGEDGKIGKKPAGPIDEFFGNRDEENRRRRKRQAARASDKTANYHDLLKYYQYGIARIPRHKREKAGIPQAMHDRYSQEVWDILKKEYPNKGLSDTPPSDWRDSVDELIMSFGNEGNFKETIFNPFYDIYAKLGPTDSHKKQLGIEEESDTDVGGGAKQAIGLDIDDEGASDAALDSEVNKMGYAESKEFNFKKMIKEALTPNYLK